MPYKSEKGMDEKQEAILKYIREYHETLGQAPSVSEILLETKIGISAVNGYLKQLERAGYIEQGRFGIRLTAPIPANDHLTQGRKLRVFLCHASQDKPVVRELYQRLLAEGWIDPWLDAKKLLPGQDWRMAIEQAVETADNVIICLSNNSVSKEGYVQKEMRYAQEISLEKPEGTIFLIPLKLEECETPRGLRFFQWTNYFGEQREQSYKDLLESLRIRLEDKIRKETEEKTRREREEQVRLEKEEQVRKKSQEREANNSEANNKISSEQIVNIIDKMPEMMVYGRWDDVFENYDKIENDDKYKTWLRVEVDRFRNMPYDPQSLMGLWGRVNSRLKLLYPQYVK